MLSTWVPAKSRANPTHSPSAVKNIGGGARTKSPKSTANLTTCRILSCHIQASSELFSNTRYIILYRPKNQDFGHCCAFFETRDMFRTMSYKNCIKIASFFLSGAKRRTLLQAVAAGQQPWLCNSNSGCSVNWFNTDWHTIGSRPKWAKSD